MAGVLWAVDVAFGFEDDDAGVSVDALVGIVQCWLRAP
jgi:hypothetical protein